MTQEPMKCLVKADEARKEAFVAEYAVLREEAQRTEARDSLNKSVALWHSMVAAAGAGRSEN